ncbi:MAG: ABC transporter ATP-binding protein [Bradymonadia bacterium]
MSMLQISGVHKAYKAVRALNGVDMTIGDQGIYGLVGPNGAGKTTLFSVICGFLGADSGTVTVAGQKVSPQQPPASGVLSILPQDARFPTGVPVGELLTHYARLQGMSKGKARVEAERVLALVNLSEVFKRSASTLSHGMYKRVGIAQAFIGNPKLVILDEPTAGLDPHAAREVRGMVRSICIDRCVIVSSHNLLEIEDLCQHVTILHKGQVVRQAEMGAIKGEGAEVSFRMSSEPDADVSARLASMPEVSGVEWDVNAGRLRVLINTKMTTPEEVSSTLVQVLVTSGVKFLDMSVGASLEDRFLRETGGE